MAKDARAEPADADIQAVITAQVQAFRADDFPQAFTYASPMIQGIFGTAEQFGAMVATGYPMVHQPDEFRFLELREISGKLWQKVMFRDASGAVHILDYQMITGDAGWKINAVQILDAPEVGA